MMAGMPTAIFKYPLGIKVRVVQAVAIRQAALIATTFETSHWPIRDALTWKSARAYTAASTAMIWLLLSVRG